MGIRSINFCFSLLLSLGVTLTMSAVHVQAEEDPLKGVSVGKTAKSADQCEELLDSRLATSRLEHPNDPPRREVREPYKTKLAGKSEKDDLFFEEIGGAPDNDETDANGTIKKYGFRRLSKQIRTDILKCIAFLNKLYAKTDKKFFQSESFRGIRRTDGHDETLEAALENFAAAANVLHDVFNNVNDKQKIEAAIKSFDKSNNEISKLGKELVDSLQEKIIKKQPKPKLRIHQALFGNLKQKRWGNFVNVCDATGLLKYECTPRDAKDRTAKQKPLDEAWEASEKSCVNRNTASPINAETLCHKTLAPDAEKALLVKYTCDANGSRFRSYRVPEGGRFYLLCD